MEPNTKALPQEEPNHAPPIRAIQPAATSTPFPPQNVAPVPVQAGGKTDDEVVAEISGSSHAPWFWALMNGEPRTCQDMLVVRMTLLRIIATYTHDPNQIDRIFRRGAIVPNCWDEMVQKDGKTSGRYSYSMYCIHKVLRTLHITVPTIYGPRHIVDLSPDANPLCSRDDIGLSYIYCTVFQDCCRYCTDNDHWYIFNGKYWENDDGRVMEYSKMLTTALAEYAKKCAELDCEVFPQDRRYPLNSQEYAKRDPYLKHAIQCKSRRARETLLKDARTDSRMTVSLSKFDRNPYLFNCTNGTLNLRDRTFHPHSPQDMLTKMAAVEYNPYARNLNWEQHIMTVMDGDVEKARFLQKCFGYSLTGTNKYTCMFILYGPRSRNGKSATVDAFNKMMGDYGDTANPETFAQKFNANGSAHSDDLAKLVGVRFVSIPESERNMTLSSSLVKRCTGDDKITARPIYEKQFSYMPQFKLFFHTNHLPRINDLSMFESDRVKVIPFEHYFEEKDRNLNMIAELTTPDGLSAILNWALEGWRLLESTGFTPPQSVLNATSAYYQESDKVGRFMDECMVENAAGVVSTRATYERYKNWCMESGLRPLGELDFKKSMERKGIRVGRPRVNGSQITAYIGWQMAPL